MVKIRQCSIIMVIFIMLLVVLEDSGAASELSVTLEFQPPNTTIAVNSSPIAIIAKAEGTELKFEWQLAGVGDLQGSTTGTAIVYVLPEKIEGESSVAIVSVKVRDYKGQEATESVILTISAKESSSAPSQASPPSNGELIFHENFENGIKGLEKRGKTIQLVKDTIYGTSVKISRTNRRGFTDLTKKFTGYSGTLIFEAMLRWENVVQGYKDYYRGRFITEVIGLDGEKWYPSAGDFDGTQDDWMFKRLEVLDLDGTESVELMIGLLNAKGTVYLDEVKVYHQP